MTAEKKDTLDQEAPSAQAVPVSQANSPKSTPETKDQWSWLGENVKLVAIALAIAAVVRIFIAEPRFIPSPSMVPTLAVGDRLLVEKVSYHLHRPQAGDIVVFEPPPQLQEYGYSASQAFIKRVIGLPGQQIQITGGQVYVDGSPLEEDYIYAAPTYEMPAVDVPAGSLFVMGDNRNDSNDSHVWGFLPVQNVIGRATLRFWPLNKISLIA